MHLRAALAQAGFELLSSSANEQRRGQVLLYGFFSFVNEHGQVLRFGAALGAAWRCSTNQTAPPGNCSQPPRRCAMTTG
jgi:hypothetical protein